MKKYEAIAKCLDNFPNFSIKMQIGLTDKFSCPYEKNKPCKGENFICAECKREWLLSDTEAPFLEPYEKATKQNR